MTAFEKWWRVQAAKYDRHTMDERLFAQAAWNAAVERAAEIMEARMDFCRCCMEAAAAIREQLK